MINDSFNGSFDAKLGSYTVTVLHSRKFGSLSSVKTFFSHLGVILLFVCLVKTKLD